MSQYLSQVSTLAVLASLWPAFALADEATGPDRPEILVTGTRAAGRTVETSAAPIDVLDASAIQKSAEINLLESLNRLLPSFNLPARVQPDLGSMVRAGQLRNLDPAYTLVLVNGKRRHTTAVVNEDGFPGSVAADLGLIPAGAIGRVEVLRDGASAIYGSDAIAGVINIILRKDLGFSASGQIGQTYEGDGESGYLRLGGGFALGERGYIRVDGEYGHQSIAVRNFPLQPAYLSYPAIRNSDGALVRLGPNNALPAGASPNPAEATRDPSPWKNLGVPRLDTYALSGNLEYELGDTVSFYAFGTFAHRKGSSPQNFRLPNTLFISNPGLLEVYPHGFTPYETISENDYALTAGLKGDAGPWSWDLSGTYGRDDIDVGVKNSANYSLTYPGGQTDFYIGNRNYSRLTANLDIARTIANVFGPDADLSFGVEYSRETQELNPGEPSSYFGSGSSALVGYHPLDQSDTSRHSVAGYLGFGFRPVQKWLIDAAGRIEDYSDFGTNVSGRLSTRYDFSDTLSIRATISNGFHAPALVTQSYSNTSDHAGVPYVLAQPASVVAQALGSSPLKPEKAVNYSVGLVLSLPRSVYFTLDLYQIDIDNRLGVSSNVGIDYTSGSPVDGSGRPLAPEQEAILRNLLERAGLTVGQGVVAHYFTNVGSTRTRGLDAVLGGRHGVGNGTLHWNASLNVNRTRLTEITPVPASLQGLPNIGTLTASAQYALRLRAPLDKETISLSYDIGPWDFGLRTIRYGKLRRLNTLKNEGYTIPAAIVVDAHVSYQIRDGVQLTVGANNLFDKRPAQTPEDARTPANKAQYTGAYDNSGPLGVLGGQYYGRISVNF